LRGNTRAHHVLAKIRVPGFERHEPGAKNRACDTGAD
jgi:hypothetical protein